MGEGVEAVPLWAVLPALCEDRDGFVGLLAGRTQKVATIDKINEATAQA
jgi:hypothetical protein